MDNTLGSSPPQRQGENQQQKLGGHDPQSMKPRTEAPYGQGVKGGFVEVIEPPPTTEVRTGPLYSTDTFESELGEEDTRRHKRDRNWSPGKEVVQDKSRD